MAGNFGFPEGPCFDAAGEFHFTDGRSGWIEKVRRDGTVEHVVNTGGGPNGAAFDSDNALFICEARNSKILKHEGGALSVFADSFDSEEFRGPNDLILHPDGAVYFTDPSGSNEENPIGRIYRVETDGTVHLLAEGYAFPNGLAFSADAGLGNLYVAHFGAGQVAVFSPEGEPIEQLPVGGEKPTNVAFGGPDMRELWVTEVETAAIYRLRSGIEGLRPFRDPRGQAQT